MHERLSRGFVTHSDLDALAPRLTAEEHAELRQKADQQHRAREVAKLDRGHPGWREKIDDAVAYAEAHGIPASQVMNVVEAAPLLVLFRAVEHERENTRLRNELTQRDGRAAQQQAERVPRREVERLKKQAATSHKVMDAKAALEALLD